MTNCWVSVRDWQEEDNALVDAGRQVSESWVRAGWTYETRLPQPAVARCSGCGATAVHWSTLAPVPVDGSPMRLIPICGDYPACVPGVVVGAEEPEEPALHEPPA